MCGFQVLPPSSSKPFGRLFLYGTLYVCLWVSEEKTSKITQNIQIFRNICYIFETLGKHIARSDWIFYLLKSHLEQVLFV